MRAATFDDDDPTQRTIVFDPATFDDFLTAFRGAPGIIEALADKANQRPNIRVVAGGRP